MARTSNATTRLRQNRPGHEQPQLFPGYEDPPAPPDPMPRRTRGEVIDQLFLEVVQRPWGQITREARCERLLRLVDELGELGRSTAPKLAERLGRPYMDVRQDLRMLSRAGLVEGQRGRGPNAGWFLSFRLVPTPLPPR